MAKQKNEEIDLYELTKKVSSKTGKMFIFLFNFFKYVFLQILIFVVRKFAFLLILAVAGAIVGGLVSWMSKTYYESNLFARSNLISTGDMIQYINRIHKLCVGENIIGLSQTLNLDTTIAKNIKDLQAFWIIDINNDGIGDYLDKKTEFIDPYDTTRAKRRLTNQFNIRLQVYDNSIIEEVQQNLELYINSNDYFKKLSEIKKARLKALISKTGNEIFVLDSLKRYEYFTKEEIPEITIIEKFIIKSAEKQEARLLHGNVLNLFKNKQALEKDLELRTEPITILGDFPLIQTPVSFLSKNIVKFIRIFLAIGIIILLLVDQRENIKKLRENSYKSFK